MSNVQDHLDMGTKGESQSLVDGMTTSEHSKFFLDSTLAESDWETQAFLLIPYKHLNQISTPTSGPNALEGGSANLLEEYTTLNHDGDVHIKLPTVEQRVMGKKLAETASNYCLSTAGFEQCIP